MEIQTGLGWLAVAVVSSPFGAVTTNRPLPLTMLGSPKPSEPCSLSGVVNPACEMPPPTAAAGVADETRASIATAATVATTRFLGLTNVLSSYASVLLGVVETARAVDLERHVVGLCLRVRRRPFGM